MKSIEENLMCTLLEISLSKEIVEIKLNQDAHVGPYTVTEVQNSGTVRVFEGNITDTYNLRNIIPFKNRNIFHYGVVYHWHL